MAYSETAFYVGGTAARYFCGWLDEVRLSDQVLTVDRFLDARTATGILLSEDEPADTLLRYRMGDGAAVRAACFEAGIVTNECKWITSLAADVDGSLVNLADYSSALLGFATSTHPVEGAPVASNVWYQTGALDRRFPDAASVSFADAGGYTTTLPSAHYLDADDFTAEFFLKTSAKQDYLSFLLMGSTKNDPVCRWKIGTDQNQKLTFGYPNSSANYITTNFSNATAYADGVWHHVAVVYRKQDKTAKLYFDGKFDRQVDLPVELGSFTDDASTTLLLGKSSSGSFNGQMDEVRVTGRALEPSEFLNAFYATVVQDGQMMAHWSFDNAWTPSPASVDVACAAVPSAHSGGSEPTFAADVRRGGVYEGREGALFSTNTHSAVLSKGLIRLRTLEIPLFRQKQLTVEWFAKLPKSQLTEYAPIVQAQTGTSGNLIWRVAAGCSVCPNRPYLVINPNGSYVACYTSTSMKTLNDGKWHHMAVTTEENDAGTHTILTLWVDYASYVSYEMDYPLRTLAGEDVTFLVAPANNGYIQNFGIDEFRVTKGVKTADRFLVQRNGRGLCVVFR